MNKKNLTLANQMIRMSSDEVLRIYEMTKKQELLKGKYTLPTKPSSDGRFHIYVKDETKKSGRRAIAKNSIEELIDALLEFENQKVTSSMHFSEVFERYLEMKVKLVAKKPEKLISTKNTVNANKRVFNRFIKGTSFENLPIEVIVKRDIDNLLLEIVSSQSVKRKAFNNLRTILSMTFKYAVDEEIITINPCDKILWSKYFNSLEESTSIEYRYYSDEELKKMLDYVRAWQKRAPSYSRLYAFELQLLTAMRRAELPPLKWSDISDETIFIHQEMLRQKEEGKTEEFKIVNHTKNYTDRHFPIYDKTADCLRRLKEMHDKYYPDSEFLFPSNSELGCLKMTEVYRVHVTVCRNLGIEISNKQIKGPHAFRRTHISKYIDATGDIETAAELYGNSPDAIRSAYKVKLKNDIKAQRKILETM